jgi:hypothetical protein
VWCGVLFRTRVLQGCCFVRESDAGGIGAGWWCGSGSGCCCCCCVDAASCCCCCCWSCSSSGSWWRRQCGSVMRDLVADRVGIVVRDRGAGSWCGRGSFRCGCFCCRGVSLSSCGGSCCGARCGSWCGSGCGVVVLDRVGILCWRDFADGRAGRMPADEIKVLVCSTNNRGKERCKD